MGHSKIVHERVVVDKTNEEKSNDVQNTFNERTTWSGFRYTLELTLAIKKVGTFNNVFYGVRARHS